jgi:hypothetical protein
MRYFKVQWLDINSGDGFASLKGVRYYFNVLHLSIEQCQDIADIGVVRGVVIDGQISLENS